MTYDDHMHLSPQSHCTVQSYQSLVQQLSWITETRTSMEHLYWNVFPSRDIAAPFLLVGE